jgi:hypothetical protein
VTTGVDFDQQRADFEYGGAFSDTLRFHVGGFYRQGEGVRKTGFNGDRGGQVKINVTKEFERRLPAPAREAAQRPRDHLPAIAGAGEVQRQLRRRGWL